LIEIAVEDSCSGLEQQVSATGHPAHRLTLVEAFVYDLLAGMRWFSPGAKGITLSTRTSICQPSSEVVLIKEALRGTAPEV
jgi:hypothetical protein